MFGIQVYLRGEWHWLFAASGIRYEFSEEYDAERVMTLCYPDLERAHRLGGPAMVRVQPINEE